MLEARFKHILYSSICLHATTVPQVLYEISGIALISLKFYIKKSTINAGFEHTMASFTILLGTTVRQKMMRQLSNFS